MEALTHVQELLSTGAGTEGQLLIPRKIHDEMINAVDKALLARDLAAIYMGPGQVPGSSVDINLETPNSLDVREVGEGAEIPLDSSEYTSFNIKPKKYGVSIRITRELQEDANWNLLQRSVRMAGQKVAENENSLVISDALDNATNTVAGGAAISIANITRAIQHIEDADHEASDFIVGNEVANDLRNIDTFVEADKAGNNDILQRGFMGSVFGMKVHRVSTNAGMTATSSYVIDRKHAYVIVEKRALTTENFDLPSNDMSATVVTQRLGIRHLRADAIAKITTS